MKFLTRTNDFDSSDDEERQEELVPLHIDWVDIGNLPFSNSLGVTTLPGCIFRDIHRNLQNDIDFLKQSSIQDVFVFCTNEELHRYHVPSLVQTYSNAGLLVHHFPFEHGDVPSKEQTLLILQDLTSSFYSQRKILLHCHEGLGRSCLVIALFMLSSEQNVFPDEVIEKLKHVQGSCGIQTVKQYNFIHEFNDFVREEKVHESLQALRHSGSTQSARQRRVSR